MELNSNEKPSFGDLTNLTVEKLQELDTVLTSILNLPIARDTYAQIIDGKPIRTPYSDDIKARKSRLTETIIVSDNAKPSPHALQEFEKIRTRFATQDLRIDLKLAQRYQNAPTGSREHSLRLLEVTAASVHALARVIHASSHTDVDIWPPEPPQGHAWQFRDTDHFYVDFYHTNYRRFESYPFGLLDVVGYWAEAELLGGVVLFERKGSDSEIINAFLHPQAEDLAFQLSGKQLKCIASLGNAGYAAKTAKAETIFPFSKEPSARTEPTFVYRGEPPLRIYKNVYDQQPVEIVPMNRNCVITQDSEEGKKFDGTMNIIKGKGWNRPSPKDTHQPEPSKDNTPPSP